MPYVWIPDEVDTRLMNRYAHALRDMLTDPDGPQELGILQLCQELDRDANLYSAVWAHLDHWMQSRIKDIRGRFPEQGIVSPTPPAMKPDMPPTNVITDDSVKF